MFTLTIRTSNAAFWDDEADEQGNRAPDPRELARILRQTADRIEDGHQHGVVSDYNGHGVGEFTVNWAV